MTHTKKKKKSKENRRDAKDSSVKMGRRDVERKGGRGEKRWESEPHNAETKHPSVGNQNKPRQEDAPPPTAPRDAVHTQKQ